MAPVPAKAVWTAPSGAATGQTVTLDGTRSTGDGPLTCTWSFENQDGSIVWGTQTGCKIQMTFQNADTKYVTLKVESANGTSDSNRQSFAVTSTPSPTPTLTPTPTPTDRPPMVLLTKPTAGASFTNSLAMAATAGDDKGVARVEFWFDGARVATDTTAPYSYTYRVPSTVTQGNHTVAARAFDTAGQVTSVAVTARRGSGTARSSARRASGWRVTATPLANGGTVLSASGIARRSATVTYAKCNSRVKLGTVRLLAGRDGKAAGRVDRGAVCLLQVRPR